MVKKKLDSYRGKLTSQQIADGMKAALKNAKRLVEDAKILFDADRFPTAASIAILAIEESGKQSILRSLALAGDQNDTKDAWKDYRSHIKKNVAWLLPQLVAKGARKLDDLRPLFEENSNHPYLLDQVKQIGFYTDCLGEAHWSEPINVIDKNLSKTIIRIADIMVRDREITKLEIDLWIKHLKPVWQKDPSWMKQALINWYQEMKKLKLVEDSDNDMEIFIHEGLDL